MANKKYMVQHDFSGSATLSNTIAHAVSDVTELDVTEIGHMINRRVNPECLDKMFRNDNAGNVRFNSHLVMELYNREVVVWHDGRVEIYPERVNNLVY